MTITHRLLLLAVMLGSLLFVPGFVCANRVERLEGEVDALRLQFEEIQQRINNDQTQLTEMILRADEKQAELEVLQQKADTLLKRNSADLGVQLDDQKIEVAALRGDLELLRKKNVELSDTVAAIVATLGSASGQAVQLPEDADGLFAFGAEKLALGQYDHSMLALDEFVASYPDDARIPEALAKYAAAQHGAGLHTQAIATAKRLMQSFSTSPQVPEAIVVMGNAALVLKKCDVATAAFDTLEDFPAYTDTARIGKARLRDACP